MSDKQPAAETHLLSLIRQGDQDGWAQFVQRYQGRMIAFAQRQVDHRGDAEDLVQEAFIGFLQSLDRYRHESGMESWLFRILRRRIIDQFRCRGKRKEIPACALSGQDDEGGSDLLAEIADNAETPSMRFERGEEQAESAREFSAALHDVIGRMKSTGNLRDLMVTEGLFYAKIGNRRLSQCIDVDEGTIAVVRHRLLKRIRQVMHGGEEKDDLPLPSSDLLTVLWERDRPSCPKRTTLGKSLIGILQPDWQRYIDFHVDTLGCQYCLANRADLSQEALSDESDERSGRIYQSTIGFFSRSSE